MGRKSKRTRLWVVLIVAALAAVVAATAGLATTQSGPTNVSKIDTSRHQTPVSPRDRGVVRSHRAFPAPTADELATLRQLALGTAQVHGGSKPDSINVVSTTRRAAVAIDGDGDVVNTDQPVYLVSMTGHFVINIQNTPLSENVVTFTYDPVLKSMWDLTFERTAPDLSQLGPVYSLTS